LGQWQKERRKAEDMKIPKLDYSASFTSDFADFAGIQSAGFRFIS
jgi:hypothetical protein